MRALYKLAGPGSRALSYLLGLTVIGLALSVMITEIQINDIIVWSGRIFGSLFLVILCGLVYVAALALVKTSGCAASEPGVRSWFEAGVQAANAIATLALTYTLLGISLGIGSLAEHNLNPQTIQEVIKGLTNNFSMAFMTTVVGLPVSASLRAMLMVAYSRAQERDFGRAKYQHLAYSGD
jgi:hypothetical protein